ncbi:hypothetical protein OSB04_002006 [Centaurea solstitialis]|uniref:Uncharacterized protein n=1 Tax=Centaurea solstitialis TaxID=347529 RepID=A0AA38TS37_9ASTR|nr:hypothetical protein OSB04_002006 [Centaurea solstitialis]
MVGGVKSDGGWGVNKNPRGKLPKKIMITLILPSQCDDEALAVANSMHALRHLQLSGSTITGVGLRAILHGCSHLESLDIRSCFKLVGNLKKIM